MAGTIELTVRVEHPNALTVPLEQLSNANLRFDHSEREILKEEENLRLTSRELFFTSNNDNLKT